jgi:hypothetical protein
MSAFSSPFGRGRTTSPHALRSNQRYEQARVIGEREQPGTAMGDAAQRCAARTRPPQASSPRRDDLTQARVPDGIERQQHRSAERAAECMTAMETRSQLDTVIGVMPIAPQAAWNCT